MTDQAIKPFRESIQQLKISLASAYHCIIGEDKPYDEATGDDLLRERLAYKLVAMLNMLESSKNYRYLLDRVSNELGLWPPDHLEKP